MIDHFSPQPGDLLFQQKDLSPIHRVISQAFRGYMGYSFNHVALCVDEQRVIEATTPAVQHTEIPIFLNSSGKDDYQRPRVWVFRLKSAYSHLTVGAIAHAQTLLGLPYNRDFGDRKDSYYCSELILDSFRHANQGIPLFSETPMNFKDSATGEFFEYWINHYHQLKKPIPHGKPGSHPSLLTLSDKLEPVYLYGDLLP